MEEIIRFTDPEQDERLKNLALNSDGDAVIKNIYGYLKQYGAVRKDVYELFLEEGERFSKPDYNFLIELLRGQAERAWFELILRIGNENLMTPLYKREVMDAMRKGMSVAFVSECYGKAMVPYDMYLSLQGGKEEQCPREEQETLFLRKELKEVTEALECANEELERLRKENEELRKESLVDSMENSIEDISLTNDIDELEDVLEPEDAICEPEQQEAMVEVVTDPEISDVRLEKKKVWKMCDLFQRIRRIRHRMALEKMTQQRRMEELFVLLRQQRYTPEMIKNVRTLIEYGITFEFLYAFIESEASETELKALVAFKAPSAALEERRDV